MLDSMREFGLMALAGYHAISFGERSRWTAEDVARDAELAGRVAIVTGSNSGIGKETARMLAMHGARVILGCRDLARAEEAAADIRSQIQSFPGHGAVEVMKLDLASLDSVKAFVQEFLAKSVPLHLLINNAGLMSPPTLMRTADGFEAQIGTNHLGHFYLTKLLERKLISSGPDVRVICVASEGHVMGHIEWDNLNYEVPGTYSPWRSYGTSKLANILFAAELNRRLQSAGVTAVSLHPGAIATDLMRYVPWHVKLAALLSAPAMKSVPQGAATSVFCAVVPRAELQGGCYYKDCAVHVPANAEARDPDLARRLWEWSEAAIQAAALKH